MTTAVICDTKQKLVEEVAARLSLLDNDSKKLAAARLLVEQLEPKVDIFPLSREFAEICQRMYRAAGSVAGNQGAEWHQGFWIHTTLPWQPIFGIARVSDSSTGKVWYKILPT